jgi:hypothetical protein
MFIPLLVTIFQDHLGHRLWRWEHWCCDYQDILELWPKINQCLPTETQVKRFWIYFEGHSYQYRQFGKRIVDKVAADMKLLTHVTLFGSCKITLVNHVIREKCWVFNASSHHVGRRLSSVKLKWVVNIVWTQFAVPSPPHEMQRREGSVKMNSYVIIHIDASDGRRTRCTEGSSGKWSRK